LKLAVFGDEFCHGEGTFGGFIADKLNIECADWTLPDTSNQRIFQDVINYVCTHHPQENNHILLIGWTDPAKVDVYLDSRYYTFQKDRKSYPHLMVNKLHIADRYFFDSNLVMNDWATMIVSLQGMLNFMGVKYYMFNTSTSILNNDLTQKKCAAIDTKYYWNPMSAKHTFKRFCDDRKITDVPMKQKTWGKQLMIKIREANLL